MTKILLTVTGWIIKNLGLLLLLVLVLLLTPSVKNAWQIVENFHSETVISEVIYQTIEIAPDINNGAQELRDRLNEKQTERLKLEQISCILPTCALEKNAQIYRADVEIEVISQALIYARGGLTCQEYLLKQPSVDRLSQTVKELNKSKPWWAPQSREHKHIVEQLRQLEIKQTDLWNLCQRYRTAPKSFEVNQRAIKNIVDARHTDFLKMLHSFQKSKEQTLGQILAVLPSALWLLLGIILAPIGCKTFAYFGVAPLAALIFDIRLLPSSTGALKVVSPNSPLQEITLKEEEELLFAPELLRSTPVGAHKSTQYLLDRSMPLTSIACGMFFLTRISGESEGIVKLGCDNVINGHNNKLTVLEIPEYSALVLQPRCLAGIVQNINRPIKISRHWRLGNLSSWLTLQLRYVVFHGPAMLVLKGSNGIEVDPVDTKTTISQGATLGFSANLGYSVSRCETFYSYFSGKKALLNDRFSSGPGFYIHEISPGKKPRGVWRQLTHPLEIVWELLTKAVGI